MTKSHDLSFIVNELLTREGIVDTLKYAIHGFKVAHNL